MVAADESGDAGWSPAGATVASKSEEILLRINQLGQRRAKMKLEREASPATTIASNIGEEAPPTADEDSASSNDEAEKDEDAPKVRLSKRRALALQQELLGEFVSPSFQKALHELARIHNDPKGCSREFASGFRKLVRNRQVEVIPRYGFEPSEEGVEMMLRSFTLFHGDPDIYINEVAIKEALSLEVTASKANSETCVCAKPATKERVLELLRVQLREFSKAIFQQKLNDLKQSYDTASGRLWKKNFIDPELPVEDPDGYYHLPGRAELALRVQKRILPRFGFEGTKDGVKDMICHCASYLEESDVAHLFDSLNMKLGMSPDACRRFRKLASQLPS